MATKKTSKTAKTTTKTTTRRPAARKPMTETAPRIVEATIPDEYRPISMWGYFGYQILFAIPVIGWILCIGFAFMANNRNLRNFSRSQFCWLIIYIIIFCVHVGMGALKTVLEAFSVI